MSATLKLRCVKCSYNNEPERVYCHNCGEKLDRSKLPQISSKDELREAKRVQKMVRPRNPWLRLFLKGAFDSVILGLFTALLVLAFLPPKNQPAAVSDEARLSPPQLALAYERSMRMPQPPPIVFSEEQLNAFLAARVRSKPTELVGGLEAANERTFARLLDARAEVTLHNRVGPVPVYFTTIYEVEDKEGGRFRNVGGRIGRMPLHPLLMKNLEPLLFGSLAKPLRQEILYLQRSIKPTITEGQVILTPQRPTMEE